MKSTLNNKFGSSALSTSNQLLQQFHQQNCSILKIKLNNYVTNTWKSYMSWVTGHIARIKKSRFPHQVFSLRDHRVAFFEDKRTNSKHWKRLDFSLNYLKHKHKPVPNGDVSSPFEPKTLRPPGDRNKKCPPPTWLQSMLLVLQCSRQSLLSCRQKVAISKRKKFNKKQINTSLI